MNEFIIHMNETLKQDSLTDYTFGCSKDAISEVVVIAPNWKIDIFREHVDSIQEISQKVYTVTLPQLEFTFIRTGMGASFVGDSILALAGTRCKTVIFVGSVGGLNSKMSIGDIVIPKYSICGEGFSRYLEKDLADCFGHKYYPDEELNTTIYNFSKDISSGIVERLYGKVYSTDTIIAEYMNLNRIQQFKPDCIEMETSAFYKAASYMELKATAILMVLDNTIEDKPLFTELCENDKLIKRECKFNLIPKIIIKTIQSLQ